MWEGVGGGCPSVKSVSQSVLFWPSVYIAYCTADGSHEQWNKVSLTMENGDQSHVDMFFGHFFSAVKEK